MNNVIRVPNTPAWAYYCGHEAYQLGHDTSKCPYDEDHELRDHWLQGWYDAMGERGIVPESEDIEPAPFITLDRDPIAPTWADGTYSHFALILPEPPDYAEDQPEMDYSHLGLSLVFADCDSDNGDNCEVKPTRFDIAKQVHARVPDPLKFLLDHLAPATIAHVFHDVDQHGNGELSALLCTRLEQYIIESMDAYDGFATFHGELDVLRGEMHRILPKVVLLPGQEVQVTCAKVDNNDPHEEGYQARKNDEHLSANPYVDACDRLAWAKGWLEADAETASLLEQINARIEQVPERDRRALFESRFEDKEAGTCPYDLGHIAYRAGVQLTANPFNDGDEATDWADGWNDARADAEAIRQEAEELFPDDLELVAKQCDNELEPAEIPGQPGYTSAYRQGWWTAYAMNGDGAAYNPYLSDTDESRDYQKGFAAGCRARGTVFEEGAIARTVT